VADPSGGVTPGEVVVSGGVGLGGAVGAAAGLSTGGVAGGLG
jgi:hypothetical protein